MTEPRWGAYGLIPSGPVEPRWWNRAPRHWTPWDVTWRPLASGERIEFEESPDVTVLGHQPSGYAVIERRSRRTTLFLEAELSPEALIHPYIGSTALAWAAWQGWHTFHAGSVVIEGMVWSFLGEREQGKTSTVAWFARKGVPILADDILVLNGGTALAGPRALDLREPASRHFGLGSSIGVVGTRERWRHRLEPVPPELPFGGFVVLEWHPDSVGVEVVRVAERLRHLGSASGMFGPDQAERWLDLVSFPMLRLRRPRSWEALDLAMEALLTALS